jgi:hypothetical protein
MKMVPKFEVRMAVTRGRFGCIDGFWLLILS